MIDKIKQLIKIKDTSRTYSNPNHAYYFKAQEIANHFRIARQSVYISRVYSKRQQTLKEANELKQTSKLFIEDKLDKLYALDKIQELLYE